MLPGTHTPVHPCTHTALLGTPMHPSTTGVMAVYAAGRPHRGRSRLLGLTFEIGQPGIRRRVAITVVTTVFYTGFWPKAYLLKVKLVPDTLVDFCTKS